MNPHLHPQQPPPAAPASRQTGLRSAALATAVSTALLLAACGGSGGSSPSASLEVLSSDARWVSGGDARIAAVARDVDPDRLQWWLNGARLSDGPVASREGEQWRLEGVIDGLVDGPNTLELRQDSRVLATLQLQNHPVDGPMFSGPQQQPFVCSVVGELGVEPLVDSDDPNHYAVRDAEGNTIGYSRNCAVETQVSYHYLPVGGSTGRDFKPLPADGSRPADMARTTLTDGREVDFIVRWERGTINRFLYQTIVLAPQGDDPDRPDTSLWNGRLIYHFQGGVGFGHQQGGLDRRAALPHALGKGYAITYSTGTRTGEHYNLVVGGETALMTKERFIERYGLPRYTVGLGASGGAIQQYVYAQNHPGLIDAAIPVQSYPDMVGQIPHVGDCELLEYYMDVTDRQNPAWGPATVKNRSWLVGLNAEDSVSNPFWPFMQALSGAGVPIGGAPGATECRVAWLGLTAGAMNPRFDADGIRASAGDRMPGSVFDTVPFSHYDDARNVYGVGPDGYPRATWDNVGVQYALESMKRGLISPEQFLDLNLKVGGWKQPSEMVAEGFPYNGTGQAEQAKVMADPSYFDPWGARNMNRWNPAAPQQPAPRTSGNLEAIRAAYTSGLVFGGRIDIPVIDWRPWLEQRLDMHNVHQSFAVRQRILQRMGNADHQVIWFTDTRGASGQFDQVPMALEVMDEWMARIQANPSAGVAGNRPTRAVDSCFASDGSRLHAGAGVWSGILDGGAAGACTQAFPVYSSSRILAGAPIEGGIFKCALKSVDTALADGTYGNWVPNAQQVQTLKAIFPQGVCDWSQPDQGRPLNW